MTAHNIYAQIHDNIVQNVIVCDNYEFANRLSRISYGDDAFAIDAAQWPVQNGDIYRDGLFYRVVDDVEAAINPIPTDEQEIARLKVENATLQNELTTTQLALVELYEGMGVM